MEPITNLEQEQAELAKKVVKQDSFSKLELIGGIDVGFDKDKIFCSIVVCNYNDASIVEQHTESKDCVIRYIPGFRAQSEMGIMIETFSKLKNKPDILFINASGVLHPRKCGLASHLGIILDQTVIGITKHALCGVITDKGVILDDEIVAKQIFVSDKAKPIFVSIGHKISLDKSVEVVKAFLKPPHLMPEPLRLAKLVVKKQNKKSRQKLS